MERTLAVAVMTLLALLGSALPVRAVTPKEALQRAEIAFADKRYEEAAAHMEDVFRLTSDPQWLARAGYARMLAGQLDQAIADLSQALEHKTLTGEMRQRAEDRYAKATLASEHLARSREEDGSWNDRQFGRSGGYGTALALMVMHMAHLPKPCAWPGPAKK